MDTTFFKLSLAFQGRTRHSRREPDENEGNSKRSEMIHLVKNHQSFLTKAK